VPTHRQSRPAESVQGPLESRPCARRGAGDSAPVQILALLALLLPAVCAPAAEQAPEASDPFVPDIPWAEDIDALARIPLRREISRAEGRISDLQKAHRVDIAARQAQERMIAELEATAAPPAGEAAPTNRASNSDQALASNPAARLDGAALAARHQQADTQYEQALAEAQRRLQRLLDHQARIDPQAPDQTRLRDAINKPQRSP
jgi:hypothetical protein